MLLYISKHSLPFTLFYRPYLHIESVYIASQPGMLSLIHALVQHTLSALSFIRPDPVF